MPRNPNGILLMIFEWLLLIFVGFIAGFYTALYLTSHH